MILGSWLEASHKCVMYLICLLLLRRVDKRQPSWAIISELPPPREELFHTLVWLTLTES